jgi:hypothetical protein
MLKSISLRINSILQEFTKRQKSLLTKADVFFQKYTPKWVKAAFIWVTTEKELKVNLMYCTVEVQTHSLAEPDAAGNDFIWHWHPISPRRLSPKRAAIVDAQVTRHCYEELMPNAKLGSNTKRMVVSIPA